MNYEMDTTRIDYTEIDLRARQLRAEATAHGMKVARAWLAGKLSDLLHRGSHQAA